MKRKTILVVFRMLFTTLSVWTFTFVSSVNQLIAASTDGLNQLTVTLQADKQSYILGEPVAITFKVTNNSTARIELPELIDVRGGTLGLRIASDDGVYRLYSGPGWYISGRRTRTPPVLQPGSTIETTATVLHNRVPQRGGLNDSVWQRVVKDEIDTEIALSKPGRYSLKAILFEKIESPPLEIYISEPQTTDDRESWKLISSHPEYAYFMQTTGDTLHGTITDQQTKEMVDSLETFINYHSTSIYVPYLRAAINKHRALLESMRKSGQVTQ
jgi:hypothetical protein